MTSSLHTLCLAFAVTGWSMGCAPAIEGIFDDRDFALFDDVPEARAQVNDDVVLVFADIDEDAGHIRTVSVDLRGLSALGVDDAVAVGTKAWDDARPCVDAVEGPLVVEEIPGGGRLFSVDADAAVRAVSVGGTITLTENDADSGAVAGSFRVDLDDGGYLEGAFRSQ